MCITTEEKQLKDTVTTLYRLLGNNIIMSCLQSSHWLMPLWSICQAHTELSLVLPTSQWLNSFRLNRHPMTDLSLITTKPKPDLSLITKKPLTDLFQTDRSQWPTSLWITINTLPSQHVKCPTVRQCGPSTCQLYRNNVQVSYQDELNLYTNHIHTLPRC